MSKQYKHKETGTIVEQVPGHPNLYEKPNSYGSIPAWAILNGRDWEPIEEKPILTTDDGVVIADGKRGLFALAPALGWMNGSFNANEATTQSSNWMFFSTPEARDEYILLNKPVLSLQECYDAICLGESLQSNNARFKAIAKSKLK